MKFEMLCLVGVVTTVFLQGGCHKYDLVQPPAGEMYMRFVDSGAVVPNPVVTTVMIEHDRIQENATLDGTAIRGWASLIDSKDYQRLIGIAIDNNLARTRQVQLPQGSCVGAREMSVIITVDGLAHTITVPGTARCDTSSWPPGLGRLISLKDSLVTKYRL